MINIESWFAMNQYVVHLSKFTQCPEFATVYKKNESLIFDHVLANLK